MCYIKEFTSCARDVCVKPMWVNCWFSTGGSLTEIAANTDTVWTAAHQFSMLLAHISNLLVKGQTEINWEQLTAKHNAVGCAGSSPHISGLMVPVVVLQTWVAGRVTKAVSTQQFWSHIAQGAPESIVLPRVLCNKPTVLQVLIASSDARTVAGIDIACGDVHHAWSHACTVTDMYLQPLA